MTYLDELASRVGMITRPKKTLGERIGEVLGKEIRRMSEVLLVIFIVLRLVGSIDWSWWLVLSPVWISVSFGILLYIFTAILKRKMAW